MKKTQFPPSDCMPKISLQQMMKHVLQQLGLNLYLQLFTNLPTKMDQFQEFQIPRLKYLCWKINLLIVTHETYAIQELKDQHKCQQESIDYLIAFLCNQTIFINPNAPSSFTAGSQSTTSSDQASQPFQMPQTGSSQRAACTGY
jgi:hypothetical protein